jgi:hypothetical protein
MKAIILITAFAAVAFGQSDSGAPPQFEDPRGGPMPREWIRGGIEMSPEEAFPLLVICWVPSPEGKFEAYQISGIPGYHSQERLKAFLTAFYSAAQSGSRRPSVIVCGNSWAGGAFLRESLMSLSQKFGFSVWAYPGRLFHSVRFVEEPKERLAAIQRAFESSEKKGPNKAPEPTPMSVTPPAAQESRRP